jgi:hypothetical protein
VAAVGAISGKPLGFLLLLGGLTARTEQPKGSREHLSGDTLDDGDNVASI